MRSWCQDIWEPNQQQPASPSWCRVVPWQTTPGGHTIQSTDLEGGGVDGVYGSNGDVRLTKTLHVNRKLEILLRTLVRLQRLLSVLALLRTRQLLLEALKRVPCEATKLLLCQAASLG